MAGLTRPPTLRRGGRGASRVALLLSAGTLVAAVALNQSAVHWRENHADSDLFAYFGWLITQGARPYLDFWDNKPPGVWWMSAAAIRLCGPGPAADVALGTVLLGGTLVSVVAAARAGLRRGLVLPAAVAAAVLLTDVRLECGAVRTETLVVLLESAAVAAYLHWLRRGRPGAAVLAGLLAGAAPLGKQSGIAAGLAIGLHGAWRAWREPRRRRGAAAALAAACVAPATAAGVLAAHGALGEAAYAVGGFNRAYFAVEDATWVHLWRAARVYRPVLEPLAAVFALAAAGLLAGGLTWLRKRGAVWRPRRMVPGRPDTGGDGGASPRGTAPAAEAYQLRPASTSPATSCSSPPNAAPAAEEHTPACSRDRGRGSRGGASAWSSAVTSAAPPRRGIGVMVLWFVLAAYLALVQAGRQGYHFMPVVAPLTLLTVYPLHLLAGRRGLARTLTARPVAAAVLVVWLWVLATTAAGSAAATARCWAGRRAWAAAGATATPGTDPVLAAVVRAACPPGETLYVWGWAPGVYRNAQRWPASRYATLEKLGQVGPHARFIFDGARGDLRARPPRVVVISAGDAAGLRPPDPFNEWFRATYAPQATAGGMEIWVRRGPQAASGE